MAVVDWATRRVLAWRLSNTLAADFCIEAVQEAYGAPEMFNTDQGSQYAAEDFQRLLAHHGIVCSMSRKGDCWDNAAMESFFSTLKQERVYRRARYRTRDEARADVFDYIERFYNPRRRHSTLGQISPAEFERQLSTQCT